MGKYDYEIKETLFEIDLSKASDKDESVKNLIDTYEKLKSTIFVEIYAHDILEKLQLIKAEKNRRVQQELFENLVTELQHKEYKKSDVYGFLNMIIIDALSLGNTICHLDSLEIINKVWRLYQEKNTFYGDIWYSRKETGLCLDMGRKVVRIQGLMGGLLIHIEKETILDTILDSVVLVEE